MTTTPTEATPKKRKPRAPAQAYMLRTCAADLTSYGGFQWPEKGPVACPDWSDEPTCGHGLHGLLHGEGDGDLLSWDEDARWLVVEVDPATVVALNGKVKVPGGVVVFCGDRLGATSFLAARCPGAGIVGLSAQVGNRSTLTGGYGSTLTGGNRSTLTGGDRSTLTGGYGSTLTGGDGSTLTGGDGSTLTGGYGSTLTGGDGSTLVVRYYAATKGRYRIAFAEVGENGIKADAAYRLDDMRTFVEVTP